MGNAPHCVSDLMTAGMQAGHLSSVCQRETRSSEKGCTSCRLGKLSGEWPWLFQERVSRSRDLDPTSSAFLDDEMKPLISGHQEAALLAKQSPGEWSCSGLQDEPSVFSLSQVEIQWKISQLCRNSIILNLDPHP